WAAFATSRKFARFLPDLSAIAADVSPPCDALQDALTYIADGFVTSYIKQKVAMPCWIGP
ncbi:MAG: hypothetical protein AAFQ66_15645, partial [Pseudomonadota bacterium]